MTNLSEPLNQIMTNFVLFLPNLLLAVILFVVSLVAASFLARLVQRTLVKHHADLELTQVLTIITRWGLIIMGTIVALQQINFNVTAFLTSLGIIGFTIGFAIQDVSKNFVAGLLLLLQEPFQLGDAINVAGHSGVVQSVDLRSTLLRAFDGTNVIIPNGDIYTSAIVNYGPTTRRLELNVGVAYDTDLDVAGQVALDAIHTLSGLMDDPAPMVVFNNFGASSIDFTLYYWVDTTQIGFFNAKDQAVRAIKVAFERAEIEIPYPIRMVHMPTPKNR